MVWRWIGDQDERLRRLTDLRHRLLDYLANQPNAVIPSRAGSRTMMPALAKAQRDEWGGEPCYRIGSHLTVERRDYEIIISPIHGTLPWLRGLRLQDTCAD